MDFVIPVIGHVMAAGEAVMDNVPIALKIIHGTMVIAFYVILLVTLAGDQIMVSASHAITEPRFGITIIALLVMSHVIPAGGLQVPNEFIEQTDITTKAPVVRYATRGAPHAPVQIIQDNA